MNKQIVIFGTSDLARLNYHYLMQDSAYEVAAFTVDLEHIANDVFMGLPLIPFETVEAEYPPDSYQLSILLSYRNLSRLRAQKFYEAKAKGYQLATFVSSKAALSPACEIGENCFIYEHTVIQPEAKIGDNVVLSPGTVVGHNSRIEDHCFCGAYATILANVTIGQSCFLGTNSTVTNNVTIGRESILGACSLISKNLDEKSVCVVPPTEPSSRRSDQMSRVLSWSADRDEQSHSSE